MFGLLLARCLRISKKQRKNNVKNEKMKGIMFNEHYGLESAVLSGRKTMTRRVIKGTYNNANVAGAIAYTKSANISQYTIRVDFTDGSHLDSPYNVGEIVAIKQSYKDIGKNHPDPDYWLECIAKAHNCDVSEVTDLAAWDNKMFVKTSLMPKKIKITGVRVERLQDISEEDCLAEGVIWTPLDYVVKGIRGVAGRMGSASSGDPSLDYDNAMIYDTALDAFEALINKVSGKGTWENNPYVWVFEFELIKE